MISHRITVLMTVYNAGETLDGAVRSILAQSFGDFEFLIVDDASMDGSTERLREWAEKDSRIRLLVGAVNRGQTACLNQGLAEARAEWIARQDADDVSAPHRLKKLWSKVRAEPELVLVGSNGWVMNSAGRPQGTLNVPLTDAAIRWAMPIQNPFIHPAVLFRNLLRYDERFRICQDWELWSRLIAKGKVANLPDRLLFYRHHEGSLSHQRADLTAEECRQIVNRAGPDGELLEQFRRGLRPEELKRFWSRYAEWLAVSPYGDQADEAVALHHLQTAGALWSHSKVDALAEISAAWKADPGHVLKFFGDRLRLPRKTPTDG